MRSRITTWDEVPIMVPLGLAAETIGISRSTLYGLLAAGTLRAKQVGKRKFITKRELHRFIEGDAEASA